MDDESIPVIQETYDYDACGNLIDGPSSPLTALLYTGEQFNATTGQYYLRARYYDPGTGRFNRLDPFPGNTSDPVSLHKYLYAGANPVMFSDPTGMLSLTGMLTNVAIMNVLTQIMAPIIKPAMTYLVEALLPPALYPMILTSMTSAVMGGGSASATGGYFIGGGLVGGLEGLYSFRTGNAAAYTYWGPIVGAMAGGGGGVTGSVYGGLVYCTETSGEYTGRSLAVSIPFKSMGTALQKKMENDITSIIGQVILFPPTDTLADIKRFLGEGPRKLAQALSVKSSAMVQFFFGSSADAGVGPVGFSLGASATIGKGLQWSVGFTSFTQVWPDDSVSF